MKAKTLFGGVDGWQSDDWTASDDSVRGGSSKSHLCCGQETAHFYGTLDTKTLGGAGFASQRTVSDDLKLDLSDYAGIQLDIENGDDKRYTFILKDDLKSPGIETGREKSSISFECDFDLEDVADNTIFFPWDAFTPTYRGKPQKDVAPLDVKNIKRASIMVRSFFDAQYGDFSLTLKSISALSEAPPPDGKHPPLSGKIDEADVEKGGVAAASPRRSTFGNIRLLIQERRRAAIYAVVGLAAFCLLYSRCAW
ncbi:complex I intermediate-associated protein 30-domain-containing protein [Neohortaea acidophila]|uniref:Complex I intermediate-associated protein 30-domain-containing protein n=1 Tax=Neohortaea acidophila TaxID=245834 RepID=A0A6A6Q394_9PEZI|nr:complex I intermediate-associated protein 30-domain-containing protein [Neohortaea acidophila]KAF2486870.1 complex I intermediate-associated protein 30-domain-containing protein [Neohortaea acidophila]